MAPADQCRIIDIASHADAEPDLAAVKAAGAIWWMGGRGGRTSYDIRSLFAPKLVAGSTIQPRATARRRLKWPRLCRGCSSPSSLRRQHAGGAAASFADA